MNLSLLLIPVIGGYWFLRHTWVTSYETYRFSGYHLFFSSAIAGLFLLTIAWMIVLVLDGYWPTLQRDWHQVVPFENSLVIAVSAALALGGPFVINLLTPKNNWALHIALRYGSAMDAVIHNAIGSGSLVEIATRNGKSYIGLPLSVTVHVRGDDDVALLPALSGYRKTDTRELMVTTDYSFAYEECEKQQGPLAHLTAGDFQVVISRTEIVSVRPFDSRAFEFLLKLHTEKS